MGADYYLFSIINQYAGQSSLVDMAAVFCAEYLIFFLAIFIIIEFRNIRLIINALASSLLAVLSNFLIALLYFRPRPFASYDVTLLIEHAANASFPSDHASVSFAIAASIFLYNRKYGSVAFAIAFLVSFARVFSGLHYVSDVAAGAFIGAVSACIFYYLIKYLSENKKIKGFCRKTRSRIL